MNQPGQTGQDVGVIILAASPDFGRCPVACRLSTALWPVLGVPALERLLRQLSAQGIKRAVVCSDIGAGILQRIGDISGVITVDVVKEELPLGTAGCIRDAAGDDSRRVLVALPAATVCAPSIDMLVKAHQAGGSELSVAFNPAPDDGRAMGQPAGVYICNRSTLRHIPQDGYFDVKEGLIARVLRCGESVQPIMLPKYIGNFRDRCGYICAVDNLLRTEDRPAAGMDVHGGSPGRPVWVSPEARIHPGARIFGPAAVMSGAEICSGAVIFGPAVVSRNCSIGRDSLVAGSVLWDNARVGLGCQVQRCLIDYNVEVPPHTVLEDSGATLSGKRMAWHSAEKAFRTAQSGPERLSDWLRLRTGKLLDHLAGQAHGSRSNIVAWIVGAVVLAGFFWSYWPGIADLWGVWQRSDEYSSGLLVPFLAGYVVWSRRDVLRAVPIKPSLWGLAGIGLAEFCRFFGLFFMYSSAERISLVVCVWSLVLLLSGWQFFRKVGGVLLFLVLMLPWPTRVQTAVTLPLQRWATSSAVFCLEMVGYEVSQEGNIIHIGRSSVAVAEACNGLRMVTAFLVISVLVVLLVKRQWWEKLILLVSSLPIALLCNTIRLAITAVAFTFLQGQQWERIFHDFGGYAMMPVALAAVVAELWVLTRLTVEPRSRDPVVITR